MAIYEVKFEIQTVKAAIPTDALVKHLIFEALKAFYYRHSSGMAIANLAIKRKE